MSDPCRPNAFDVQQQFGSARSRSLEAVDVLAGVTLYEVLYTHPVTISTFLYPIVVPLFIHPCCRQSQPAAQSIRAATMEVLYTHRPGKSAMI